MKTAFLTIATAVALIAGPASADGDHKPKHGGIVVDSKSMDMEIVAKPDLIQIYATDHGKPMKLDGAKAKVTLLHGSEKTEVDLPLAGDKFEAKGSYKVAKGTKGIASVTLPGKPAAVARFEIK
jgi:hypothetical protein